MLSHILWDHMYLGLVSGSFLGVIHYVCPYTHSATASAQTLSLEERDLIKTLHLRA